MISGTCSDLSISLEDNTRTGVIVDENLVSLRDAQLPWQSSALDARPGTSSRTTVVSRHDDVCCMRL